MIKAVHAKAMSKKKKKIEDTVIRYLRFQVGEAATDGGKKLKCSFVDGDMWVVFGAEEFKERKSLLKS